MTHEEPTQIWMSLISGGHPNNRPKGVVPKYWELTQLLGGFTIGQRELHRFAAQRRRCNRGNLQIYDLQYMGGLFNLSGYLIDQLQGQKSVLGRTACYYRLANDPVLLRGLYVGLSLESWQVYGRLDGSPSEGLLPAAAVFGADTALGPIYFAYGHAFETSLSAIYF